MKMAAAMPVLTSSSTNATDCLLTFVEIYRCDSRGCKAYWTAKSIIKTKLSCVMVELGLLSNDLYMAAVPPAKETGPTVNVYMNMNMNMRGERRAVVSR
jgi:hypothetical protein